MDAAAAFYRRLYGGGNHIAWSARDVARLADMFGFRGALPLEPRSAVSELPGALKDDVSGSGRTYQFTISTSGVDRMGDRIAVDGWNLNAYRSNPVVLWSHESGQTPIGRATRVWQDGNRLRAEMQFAKTGFAERVRGLVEQRILRTTSVGFKPGEFSLSREPGRTGGLDFTKGHELLEFSVVSVPANADALFEGVSTKSLTQAQARRRREIDIIRARASP